jgi:hypothetical protein
MWLEETISSPSGMVKWAGQDGPSQKACADLLATHGTSDHLVFDTGDRFCVTTSAGRVAILRVLSQTPNGWEFEATVWKQRVTTG